MNMLIGGLIWVLSRACAWRCCDFAVFGRRDFAAGAFVPEYYAGTYFRGKSEMILSRGLHMHSFRIRLFNMPELSCVTLHHS